MMTMKLVVFRQFSLPAMALWAMAMAMITLALLVLLMMVIVVAQTKVPIPAKFPFQPRRMEIQPHGGRC